MYGALVSAAPDRFELLPGDRNPIDAMLGADIVVSYNSMALVEALGLGVPAISLCGGSIPGGFAGSFDLDSIVTVMPHVRSPQELLAVLHERAADGRRLAQWRAQAQRARQRLFRRRIRRCGESSDQRRAGMPGEPGANDGALTIMPAPISEKLCAEERPRTFDAAAALRAIEAVVGNAPRPVALHEPHFGGREWDYVKETLDSGWVSSVGRYVDEFERRLAERCEVPHAVATVNGTAALHACLLLVGVQPGDEVVVPALTFIATANAVSYCGAIPHFWSNT